MTIDIQALLADGQVLGRDSDDTPGPVNLGLSVLNYGAVGNGTTDDSTAFDAALDALRGNGGVLRIPGGKTYKLVTGVTWTATTDGPLVILADGAIIDYTGTGICLAIDATSSAATTPKVKVRGGHWKGGSTGDACFRVTDVTGCEFHGCRVDGYTTGIAFHIRNLNYWSEQTTIRDCVSSSCQHAIDFEPASVSGGSGTESFARTHVSNLRVGGGTSAQPLIRCRGGVYDSEFDHISGNIVDGVIVFSLAGTMGNTWIRGVSVENSAGPTNFDGTLFDWGTFTGSTPSIAGPISLRSSIVLSSGTALAPMGRVPSKFTAYRSTDDTAVNNSTTLIDEDTLQLDVAASQRYDVEALIMYQSNATADFKLKFDAPTGSTFWWTPNGVATATAGGSGNAGIDQRRYALGDTAALGGLDAGGSTVAVAHVRGTLITSTTAGTFKVQYAQNTADVSDTKTKPGSVLHLTPINA